MRKTLALAVGLMLTVSSLLAAEDQSGSTTSSSTTSSSTVSSTTTTSNLDSGKWVVQAQGGMSIPTSDGLSSNTTAGLSLEGMIGYAFTRDFTLGLESGLDTWSTPATNRAWGGVGGLNHIPLELVAQYNFIGGSVTPYVVLGAGVAFDYSAQNPFSTSQSWTNFELDPGIGVAFNVAQDFNLFAQAKLDLDFASTTGAGGENIIPLNGTTPDSPIISIPIQIGLSFLL